MVQNITKWFKGAGLAGLTVILSSCSSVDAAKEVTLEAPKYPSGVYAEMNTSKGLIVLNLNYKQTPITVGNFVGLAEGTKKSNKPAGTPFYDGVIFHRVIPNFMIQGGDPDGTGRGGPGFRFQDEFVQELRHDGPGVLSMANSGPGTNGSQFFITHLATPWLDGRHTVFGKVIEGMNVVNSIAGNDKIITVKIVRVGATAAAFNPYPTKIAVTK